MLLPETTGSITLTVLDVAGRMVQQQRTSGKLTTVDLSKGIYLVRVEGEALAPQTQRFLVE